MTDDRIVVSRKAVMDAWFEVEEAIIAETEARKEYQHLNSIAEEKKRNFRDMIDHSEDYEDLRRV